MSARVSFRAKSRMEKRSLKKGDVVVEATPFAYSINEDEIGQYCENCFMCHR